MADHKIADLSELQDAVNSADGLDRKFAQIDLDARARHWREWAVAKSGFNRSKSSADGSLDEVLRAVMEDSPTYLYLDAFLGTREASRSINFEFNSALGLRVFVEGPRDWAVGTLAMLTASARRRQPWWSNLQRWWAYIPATILVGIAANYIAGRLGVDFWVAAIVGFTLQIAFGILVIWMSPRLQVEPNRAFLTQFIARGVVFVFVTLLLAWIASFFVAPQPGG